MLSGNLTTRKPENMPSANDTLLRQWQMLRVIPRYPRKMEAREIMERLRAEGYEVTKRTVERDLIMLSERFPLQVDDRERPYGWSWQKDAAAMDVPGMSPTEALTFMLARENLRSYFPVQMLGQLEPYFKQADLVLGGTEKQHAIAHWTEKVASVQPAQPLIPPDCNLNVVTAIHEALLYEHQLQVSYHSRSAGGLRNYRLHPLGIVLRGAITYLVATIDPYDDPRAFALHRFAKAEKLETPRQIPNGFSLQEYIAQGTFGFEQYGEIPVVLRFDAAAAEHLKESPLSTDQQMSDEEDGKVTVHATVIDNQQLRWWIMAFGDMVEVLEPSDLRQAFADAAKGMASLYRI